MRHRSFDRQLQKLEKQFLNDPLVLQLPDGTIRELHRPKDYAGTLLAAAIDPSQRTPTILADFQLLACYKLTRHQDEGLIELALAIYSSPE